MNILIVDDQKEILDGLSRLFHDTDSLSRYVVFTADNASDAYQFLKTNQQVKCDIILLDIAMDGGDGFSLLRRIREEQFDISVIMMTSYVEMNYALQAIEMHVDGFLIKPFSCEKLQEVLLDLEMRNHRSSVISESGNHIHCMMLDSYLRGEHTELDFPGLCRKAGIDDFVEADWGVVQIVIPVTDDAEKRQQTFFLELTQQHEHILSYSPSVGRIVVIAGVNNSSDFIVKTEASLQHCYKDFTAACAVRPRYTGLQSIYLSACYILENCSKNSNQVVQMDVFELRKCFVNRYDAALFSARSNKEKLNAIICELFELCQKCRIPLSGIETDLFECGLGKIEKFSQEKLPSIRLRAMLLDNIYISDDNIVSAKVDLMVRYMQKHFQEDITLATVANAADINYTYASMLFKQYQNKNFTDLLLEIRMKEAQKLICHTNCYIYEIAEKVGISNEKYFFRVFKEFYGVTPQAYRAQAKDGVSSNV